MRTIKLHEIEIENFKNLRQFHSDFDDGVTMFTGKNGCGKTTLYDAYIWLLTGFDSNGRADFKVQPIDENGITIPKLTTKVSCVFLFDGENHRITRTLRQKWVKISGSNDEVMKGNTSDYFFDDVPHTKAEFDKKIRDFFCFDEDLKLLSNVEQFFKLPTKEMRARLISMAGDMPNILTEKAYPNLYREFQVAKSIDGVKEKCKFALKNLEAERVSIPHLITENERDMPGHDFAALKEQKAVAERRIAEIDAILERKSDAYSGLFKEENELRKQLNDIESQIEELIASVEKEHKLAYGKLKDSADELDRKKLNITYDIASRERLLSEIKTRIENYDKLLKSKADEWTEVNTEEYSDEEWTVCPTCNRPFSDEEVHEMHNDSVRRYNKHKVERLNAIAEEGNRLKKNKSEEVASAKEVEDEIDKFKKAFNSADTELASVQTKISMLPTAKAIYESKNEYQKLIDARTKKKAELEGRKGSQPEDTDNPELQIEKANLKAKLNSLVEQIAEEKMIQKVIDRRNELEEKAKQISAKIAEQQQLMSEIRDYSKARIEAVEERIASMFTMVRFQMYEKNLTNDGEKEVCECLIEGVPYSTNVNTASRVNAGIDIVNAISRSIGVSVPLFIDNKESVTELISTPSQLITLQVSQNHGKITKLS